jgi:hypothetical protein
VSTVSHHAANSTQTAAVHTAAAAAAGNWLQATGKQQQFVRVLLTKQHRANGPAWHMATMLPGNMQNELLVYAT